MTLGARRAEGTRDAQEPSGPSILERRERASSRMGGVQLPRHRASGRASVPTMRATRPGGRHRLALAIDRWIGPLLCAALLPVKALSRRTATGLGPGEVSKVLLVKMWGMGSIVLASPLLRELRSRHPEARIDFATLRENAEILDHYPEISGRFAPDLSRGVVRFLVDTLAVLWRVRRERYDLVLDLEFFTRFSAIFSFLAGARCSHGFSSKGSHRGRLHDVQVPFNAYKHVSANFLALLRGQPFDRVLEFDPQAPDLLPRLEARPGSWENCRALVEQEPCWLPGRPIVVVNPNAGGMALERRWPAERISELVGALVARRDVNVVLIGSAPERPYVESIVARAGLEGRVVDLAGRLCIPELVALLANARVLVTNDSGPLHIGAAAGVSAIALFGPETPVLYAPLRSHASQRHVIRHLGLTCSPCMFVHSNKVVSCWFAEALCMTGITTASVYQAVTELLDATASPTQPVRHLRALDS